MKNRFGKYKIIIPITAAAVVAAVIVCLWTQGLLLPSWITWHEKTTPIGEDASCMIVLQGRQVTVRDTDTGDELWALSKKVKVSDYLWCDIDHDGACELLLLCWRIGRYGDAKPYWIEKDEYAWSQHIYIYQWQGDRMKPVWMASDIGLDAADWYFDNAKRLVITETSGRRTGWDWLSWGLSLIKEYDKDDEGTD